jgi:hypothetical protein
VTGPEASDATLNGHARRWLVVVVTALVGEAAATWFVVEGALGPRRHWAGLILAVVLFAVAAAAVRRLPDRWARVAVAVGCLVLVAVALHQPPDSTRDWLRYAWDGRVQLHGIDPYRYAPNSPALAHLRTGFIRGPAFAHSAHCAVPHPVASCFRIDRAGVHTIYPPVAQALFALVELIAGQTSGPRPFQVTAALAVLGVTALLLWRRSPGVAVWAWCPLVIVQYVNNAHVDAVATAFAVLGLIAAGRGALTGAGAWIGAGIATKVLPVLVLPALVGGRPGRAWLAGVLRTAAAAIAVVAVGYLPHVLAVGPAVLGYLPGYLNEEGYADGERFHLLAWFVHGPRATVVAVAVLAVVAVVAAVRANPLAPERSALLVVGAFLLVTTPTYPWYGGLLVAVAALADRPRWVVLALAAIPTYGAGLLGSSIDVVGRLSYTVAAVVVLGLPAAQHLIGGSRRLRAHWSRGRRRNPGSA